MTQQAHDLGGLLDAVRRRWLVVLLVALPLAAGVAAYAERLPDVYEGRAVVSFAPQPEADVNADTVRLLVPKYVAYLGSQPTARTIAAEVGLPDDVVESAIDASVAPETSNLTISVRLRDPVVAATAANALAREAVALSTIDPLLGGRVIAPALPPTRPAGPPHRLMEAGGALLALLAGLTAAVLVDRRRPRINDVLEMALASGASGLGRLPKSRVLRAAPAVALADPVVGTAARAMRTQLSQLLLSQPAKTLAVTSSTAGEGKTTVAAVLAASFAKVDARVLLIDADMRRPRAADLLGLQSAPGLVQLLEDQVPLAAAVQATDVPGLSVITTTEHPDAGDLLSRRLDALLQRLEVDYDLVFVDCPPLLSTDDSRTLAAMCDGTILVVSSGAEAGRVAEAADSLEALGTRVIGSVLNRSRRRRQPGFGGYGGYGGYRGTG